MALPHRPDAPELPDFSMLKRLARDQLIYLLEQSFLGRPGQRDIGNPFFFFLIRARETPLVSGITGDGNRVKTTFITGSHMKHKLPHIGYPVVNEFIPDSCKCFSLVSHHSPTSKISQPW
ncbi:hypothetical protein FD755_019370 [Muntiacus reevesi]|uniref:Uncharacterized protein n=1 Tax=Muntiacus reevesi TaxID=9886 RepID=A0A5N3X6N4_MUNRE|nr:hypothetical protein FD755_019370 [Muntiacus reevesi]